MAGTEILRLQSVTNRLLQAVFQVYVKSFTRAAFTNMESSANRRSRVTYNCYPPSIIPVIQMYPLVHWGFPILAITPLGVRPKFQMPVMEVTAEKSPPSGNHAGCWKIPRNVQRIHRIFPCKAPFNMGLSIVMVHCLWVNCLSQTYSGRNPAAP